MLGDAIHPPSMNAFRVQTFGPTVILSNVMWDNAVLPKWFAKLTGAMIKIFQKLGHRASKLLLSNLMWVTIFSSSSVFTINISRIQKLMIGLSQHSPQSETLNNY